MTAALETQVRQRLAALAPETLELADESHLHVGHGATGAHLRLRIVSARFAGMNPLQRHRLVYAALGELVGSEIHALGIEARLPGEK